MRKSCRKLKMRCTKWIKVVLELCMNWGNIKIQFEVSGTDGVGTKLDVALSKKYNTVGMVLLQCV